MEEKIFTGGTFNGLVMIKADRLERELDGHLETVKEAV
jgi:hypothetical protein